MHHVIQQQDGISKQSVLPFYLICALFLASRLLLLNYNQAEFTDGYAFINWSFSLSADGFYHVSSKHLPVYPLLIRLPAWFLDPIVSGRLISTFAGFFCLFPLYSLCLEVYGRREALLASILFTISAQILFLTTRVLSEPLFLAFSLATILHAFRLFSDSDTDSLLWLILFSGLATLTRPEALVFAPLCIFGIYRAVHLRRTRPLVLSIAPLLLWFLGAWMIYQGGSSYGNDMLRSVHSLSPGRLLRNSWTYVWVYPYLVFCPLFLFAVYNQFRGFTSKRRVWLLLVTYVHCGFLALFSVHWAWTTRFLTFPMTLLFVEVAAGIERFADRAPKFLSKVLIAASITGSVLFAMVALYYQRDTFGDIRRTGEYIRSNLPGSRVFSNDQFKESYYTGSKVFRYVPHRVYRSDDIIVLHSFYSHDLDEQVQLLAAGYRIQELFRTDSVVVPLLANTIITQGSNTPAVASRLFQAQEFTSIVLRIVGPKRTIGGKSRNK